MFGFHGFDPKTLSDNELFEKELALTTKKLIAARWGKVDSVNQLQMMILAIEQERRERLFVERIGSVITASSSVVVETEMDLQEATPTVEEIKKANKPDLRPVRRAVRTAKPVTPSKD
jgi:hypothetical protein